MIKIKSLNLSKTRIILFGNQRTNVHLEIQLDGVSIERVNEIKFLGVIIDEKISWKSQIKHVQTKMSRCITVLNKAKHALDHKSLRTLYCTLVLPYLIYCVEVWGNNYMTTIHPFLILQKKAIRGDFGFAASEGGHANVRSTGVPQQLPLFSVKPFKTMIPKTLKSTVSL